MNLILGSLVVVGCLAGGFIWAGGHLLALFQPAELLIIGGAALGAFVISNPLRSLRECWHSLPQMFRSSRYSRGYYLESLALMYEILAKVRKDGLMMIEIDIEDPENSAIFNKYPRLLSYKRAGIHLRLLPRDCQRQHE